MKVDEVLKNRRSFRKYNNELIDFELVNETLKLARRTATSVNGQQISMIITRDREKIKQIADLSWGQNHILNCDTFITFVVDYNRPKGAINSEGKNMSFTDDLESILVGAVDAGLMAQSVEMLFQAQRIGTCMIGAVRNDILKMNEILNVSENAFCILGMTIGNVDDFDSTDLDLRPRSKDDGAIFLEKYDEKIVTENGRNYSSELSKWWEDKEMSEHRSYSDSMVQYYEKTYSPDLLDALQKSNFLKNFKKK